MRRRLLAAAALLTACASGADVIDLDIGDPDQPTPFDIVESLHEAAKNPATHRYDETARGWEPFLKAAADWYRREFGVALDPSRWYQVVP